MSAAQSCQSRYLGSSEQLPHREWAALNPRSGICTHAWSGPFSRLEDRMLAVGARVHEKPHSCALISSQLCQNLVLWLSLLAGL